MILKTAKIILKPYEKYKLDEKNLVVLSYLNLNWNLKAK